MGNISNIPSQLQLFIQDEKENVLRPSLEPILGFRGVAAKEPISVGHGESVTKFRAGLLAPDTAVKSVSSIYGDTDNGLTAGQRTGEQFTITPYIYAQTLNLKKTDNVAKLIQDYAENADKLGKAAFLTLDMLAMKALYAPYMAGQTYLTANASSATTIAVDDVTGFETKMVNGVPTAVTGSNTLAITVDGVANTVTGVAVDGSNTSKAAAFGGRSGTLTVGNAVTKNAGVLVVNTVDASRIVRPFSSGTERASDLAIAAGDLLTFRQIRRAVTVLRNNGVPTIGGKYHVYLDNTSMEILQLDSEFQNAIRGLGLGVREFANAMIYETQECRFIINNVLPTQAASGTQGSGAGTTLIHRPIVVGAEALIEGEFSDIQGLSMAAGGDSSMALHSASVVEGISFVDRAPLDRLALSMTQSYFWLGGFVAPTDSLLTSSVMPSCNSARYKRAVMIPHAE